MPDASKLLSSIRNHNSGSLGKNGGIFTVTRSTDGVFVSFDAIVLISPSKFRTTLVAITANTHVSFLFITSGSPVVGIVGDFEK